VSKLELLTGFEVRGLHLVPFAGRVVADFFESCAAAAATTGAARQAVTSKASRHIRDFKFLM
jgi:hypothetical protein